MKDTVKANLHDPICLVGSRCSDNLVSSTSLTEAGAILLSDDAISVACYKLLLQIASCKLALRCKKNLEVSYA